MQQRRLERSSTNRVVAGVCGGLAEYFAVDPTLVRVFFVIAAIVTAGAFLLVYIVLLVLMPLPGQRPAIDEIWPGARTDPGSPAGTDAAPPPANGYEARRRGDTIAYVLIALGLVFLLANLGAFRFVQWSITWPLIVIALGVLLLVQRARP